jgi:uncharacterized protein YndB with AHSA1/START domain
VPITAVTSDPATLTLTAIGDYPVPVERLWAAWADPRQIERFWGPPQWPATFTRHDMTEGGRTEYHMTGPNGETAHGYWRFVSIVMLKHFEVVDGFANPDGNPNPELPETRMQIRFDATPTGSRFVSVSTFASIEAMEQMLAMGMLQGLTAALTQMDEVLRDLRDGVLRASLKILDDTHAVVTRDVRGSLQQVWRCHQEAALVQQWLLGPPGWTMPVCEVATEIGSTYRYAWENTTDMRRFGFTGVLLEIEAPRRAVTTERMIGTDGPETTNTLVLSPRAGGFTRIEVHIAYPSKELRDIIIGTGMVNGMELSYARLENDVLLRFTS